MCRIHMALLSVSWNGQYLHPFHEMNISMAQHGTGSVIWTST